MMVASGRAHVSLYSARRLAPYLSSFVREGGPTGRRNGKLQGIIISLDCLHLAQACMCGSAFTVLQWTMKLMTKRFRMYISLEVLRMGRTETNASSEWPARLLIVALQSSSNNQASLHTVQIAGGSDLRLK